MGTVLFSTLWLFCYNASFGSAFQVHLNSELSASTSASASLIRHHERIRLASTSLSSSSSSTSNLPSTYDISLPASLRGEAVRSALRSDRGTCLDFTSPANPVFNIGIVKVAGKTANFLNSKLSNSFPEKLNSNKVAKNIGVDIGSNVKLEYGQLKEAGLVTSKGKLIDKLTVLSFDESNNGSSSLESYMVTSPGHSGSMLFDRLDPFIFPLDGVKLTDMCPSISKESTSTSASTRLYTIVATKLENVQSSIQQNVVPILKKYGYDFGSSLIYPVDSKECLRYSATNSIDGSSKIELLLYEQTFLTPCCCIGYTIVIHEDSSDDNRSTDTDNMNVGSKIWENMIDENNLNGPIELGPLEYETLRIEAGVPAFGHEITGAFKDDKSEKGGIKKANASPLELNLDQTVDETKGCYQGQEAIAAQLNNKRGLPRNLYTVIFPEEDNFYEGEVDEEEYSNHSQRLSNKTKRPEAGTDLFVLGSNQSIKVGTLTSVAEKDGTSMSETVALALVRRSEAILKKMNDMGLEIDIGNNVFGEDPLWSEDASSSFEDAGSGIIYPPPLDPLDGLEVVLGESFTQGYLRPLPIKRLKNGQNIFETETWNPVDDIQQETGSVMGFIPQNDIQEEIDSSFEINSTEEKKVEAKKEANTDTEVEEEQIDLEARRKAEKMELLKKRAEEAMKRRQQKKEEQANNDSSQKSLDKSASAAAAEAERKEQKMKMLKERAEAALKRRREKNQ